MQAWDVYRGNRLIDTVFYDSDCSREYVRDGLINHDGFPSDIRIVKARK